MKRPEGFSASLSRPIERMIEGDRQGIEADVTRRFHEQQTKWAGASHGSRSPNSRAVATVRGTDWLGAMVETFGPVVFFSAEDDGDEIHHRLAAILDHHISYAGLAGFHLHFLPGGDAIADAQTFFTYNPVDIGFQRGGMADVELVWSQTGSAISQRLPV